MRGNRQARARARSAHLAEDAGYGTTARVARFPVAAMRRTLKPVRTSMTRPAAAVTALVVMPALRLAAFDQLEEAAFATIGGFVLVEEGEMLLLELVEELVPLDGFQILVIGESDAQYARFLLALFGAAHAGGPAAALLGPLANLVVIGGLLGFMPRCHAKYSCPIVP